MIITDRIHPVEPGITLDNVSFSYGGLTVLAEQSLIVEVGKTFVVGGANGVGKSTLLQIAAGLLRPSAGSILLGGRPIVGVDPAQLVRQGLRRAVVFEQGGLVSRLTALENVALALEYHGDWLGLTKRQATLRAREALARVGVTSPNTHAEAARLSLGMQKRIAFARALAFEPNYVFLDDPLLGLDFESADIVLDLIDEFAKSPNITLMITTNSNAVLRRVQTGSYELMGGRLVDRQALAPARAPNLVA